MLGVEFVLMNGASRLSAGRDGLQVTLSGGGQVTARAVVLATGVSYRQLDAPGIAGLVGAGVFYGSALSEAPAVKDQDVFIVGAGNSAGQTAVYLARSARSVTLLVRGDSLATSMSDYLVKEIEATPGVRVRLQTEVAAAHGDQRLTELVLRDRATGRDETVPAAALFVMIGATPHTDWLPDDVARDRHGFILTGSDLPSEGRAEAGQPVPLSLETSLPGVFAVGDVRAGSVQRVASAVGEGSVAVPQVHQHLQRQAAQLPSIAPAGQITPRTDIPPGRHLRVTPRGGRNSYRPGRAGPTGPGCPPSAPTGSVTDQGDEKHAADPYPPAEGPARAPWHEVLPPDPRDPDVVRAKALARAGDRAGRRTPRQSPSPRRAATAG